MKILSLILAYSLLTVIVPAMQGQSTTVQPSVLIIPYVASGQNALDKYESNFAYRTTITELNNALNERGFMAEDLQEIINRIKEDEAISTLQGVEFDPEERVLQRSTADIVIKAEVFIHTDYSGANSVQINMRALDKVSAKSLYSMNFDATPHFKTDDYGYLARRALTEKDQITKFVEGLNAAFADIREKGRIISCSIEVGANSTLTLDDEVTNDYDLMADVIIDWIRENAYQNNFSIRNNSTNQLYFDEIRIPLKNEDGQNYLPNDFATELRKFIARTSSEYLGERVKMGRPLVNNGVIRIVLP